APTLDASNRTSSPLLFALCNPLSGDERAPTAASEGAAAATPVLAHLAGAPWPAPGPLLVVRAPLVWVTPNRLTGLAGRPLLVRSGEPLTCPVVTVEQDGRRLWRRRIPHQVSPSRSLRLPVGWTGRVDRSGGPVAVSVA
ncbi:oxidoreductase, partial [Streptomyces sp. NPDC002039]